MKYNNNIEVICIGQAVLDCIIKGQNADSYHDITKMADSITLSPGGDAFNESVILSRLGHQVRIMCGLGQDLAGEILTDKLKENAIDTDAIIYDDTAQTPVAALMVAPDGSRKSISSPAHLVKFFEPGTSLLKEVKVVSLASLFRAPFNRPETILAVCQAAKKTGAIVTADTKLTYYGELTLQKIEAALPYIDYIFPNEDEAEFYTRKSDYAKMADVFLDYGVKNVIIKTGPQGCFVKNATDSFAVPAHKLTAVDTTGAGDNFVAGFISAIIRGSDLREAVQFAIGCAALCVQSIGATSGIQSLAQAEEYIRRTRN